MPFCRACRVTSEYEHFGDLKMTLQGHLGQATSAVWILLDLRVYFTKTAERIELGFRITANSAKIILC